jgi:carbon monoxide dehydrogenase subunit G
LYAPNVRAGATSALDRGVLERWSRRSQPAREKARTSRARLDVDPEEVSMKMNMSQVFECSPRELWPWLDDPERCKRWMKGLLEVRQTSRGPKGKGTTAIMVIQEGGKPVEYEETILEYEPERRFKLRMVGGCLKTMAIEVDYTLEDLGSRTNLHYEFACESQSTLLKLFGPIFGIFARMQVKRFFRTLKGLAEGGALASST